jgi:DNA-binding CsgD family transcriptional regulator
MPYKSETEGRIIPRPLQRRMKLTDAQRAEIRENANGLSVTALAARYGVSRRLVDFLLHPEKQAANLALRAERGGSMRYYDKNRHRENVKNWRRYRRSIEDRLEQPDDA